MRDRVPYCVSDMRPLSDEERLLMQFLVGREASSRLHEIEHLRVVARCGCGKCPTVLFGTDENATPMTGSPYTEVASYRGRNSDNIAVGVVLIDRQGQLAELEAWSPEGPHIRSWPPVSALERFA